MRKLALVTLFLLGVAIRPASALPITALDITAISGVWINPVGGANIGGVNSSTLTWGTGGTSSYNFAAGANIIGAEAAVPLLLGEFTHFNEEINGGTAITGATLKFGFNTGPVGDATPASVLVNFAFSHNETTNSGGGCCNDIVTIVTPIVNQQVDVVVGPDTFTYFFNMLGFSQNNGLTYNNVYSSPEGGNTPTSLYGAITVRPLVDVQDLDPVPMPEPASLILFGSGLLGLVALRRRAARRR